MSSMTNLPDSPGYWVAWFDDEMVNRIDLIPGSTSTSPYPKLYHFEYRKLGAKNTTGQLGADSHGAGYHGDWEPLRHFKDYKVVWQKLEPPNHDPQ